MRMRSLACLLVFLAACDSAENPRADDEAAVPVAAGARALSTTNYRWDQSIEYPMRLIPATEGFCYLTLIAGQFQGLAHIRLGVSSDDNYWYLQGDPVSTGGHTDQRAQATCVKWDDFAATSDRALSGTFTAKANDPSGGRNEVDLWARNSFCFLTGIGQMLSLPNASVTIDPGFGHFVLKTNSSGGLHSPRRLDADASCAYLGQVGDVVYSGGDANGLGLYTWQQGQPPVRMSGTSDSICFLTGISGNFDSYYNWAQIYPSGDHWLLSGNTPTDNHVGARARCVALNQKIPARIFDPGFEQQTQRDLAWPWSGEGEGPKGFDIHMGYQNGGANNAWIYSGSASGWSAIAQDVPVKPNTSYTFTAMVRAHGVDNQAYIGARDANGHELAHTQFGSGSFCSGTVCCVGCGDSYSRRSVTFNSGDNTQVRLFVGYHPPGSESWLQLDDFTMQQN